MTIEVRLAGPLTVVSAGRPITGPGIGSRKARTLLGVLAAHRDRSLSRDELAEQLWPDAAPADPAQNVAVLVSRLRAVLGAEAIIGGRGGYRLAAAVRIDLDDAAALTAEAGALLGAGRAALARATANRAVAMLGAWLDDADDAAWAGMARRQHADRLRAARHTLAAAALAAHDPATARAAAEAAVQDDWLDEHAQRQLMAAHRAAGEPGRALAGYELHRSRLAEELGADPALETQELQLAVLRSRHVPLREVAELVGRGAEAGLAADAWAGAVHGRVGLLLVAGEAGIGKTRLAHHLAETVVADGGAVLEARCYAAERSLFLQPLVDALSPAVAELRAGELREIAGHRADALADLLPDAAALLGPAEIHPAPPEIARRRAFEAVVALLRGLCRERPLLLVLDDLHNAGLATVELLHFLARTGDGPRLLVLATVRDAEGGAALAALADVAARLDLGPLPETAVAQLAAAAGFAGRAGEIAQRTRGHTLFVVEVLRGLAAGDPGPPESLRDAVLARLAATGQGIEALLRGAAVLGAVVEPATVAGLLDRTVADAVRACEAAAAARLLVVAGGRYEFANDLVHELVYATTPVPVRALHHRRAAELLSAQPEAVARHAAAVEDWPRAARALLLAGEDALRRFAAADAEAFLDEALVAADRDADAELMARAYVARGRAREARSEFTDALADLEAAVAQARTVGDRRLEMIAHRELGGDVPIALGSPIDACVAHLHTGLRIAQSLGDRGAAADLLARLAVIGTNRLQFVESLGFGTRAVTAGRAARDPFALAKGLDGRRNGLAYLGEVAELAEVVEELEPVLRRHGDLWRLQWTVFESAFGPLAACDWAGAARRIDEADTIAERSGYDVYRAFFRAHRGWLERMRGRMPSALHHGRAAIAGRTAHWVFVDAAALLAGTLLELGRPADALDVLGARPPDGQTEARVLRHLAPLAEASGSRAVLEEADTLLAGITAPTGSAWLIGADAYLCVARAWLGRGEPERAQAALAPLLTAAARVPWPGVLAQGLLVDGAAGVALGDHAGAAAAFRLARELAGRHGLAAVERRAAAGLGGVAG